MAWQALCDWRWPSSVQARRMDVAVIVKAAEAANIPNDRAAMVAFTLGFVTRQQPPRAAPAAPATVAASCHGTSAVLAAEMAKDAAKDKIHLVDLKANYKTMQAEIDQQVAEVMGSCWFIGGPSPP